MKLIFSYVKEHTFKVILVMLLKTCATLVELTVPYVLEHIIDDVAPTHNIGSLIFWGIIMVIAASMILFLNTPSNKVAVKISSRISYKIRKDLFHKSLQLSGSQIDKLGLPAITSRMTVDSYNLQEFVRTFQTMGVRAPMMLIGGIIVTLSMDAGLGVILCVIAPVAIAAICAVSFKGIPLYEKVQSSIDDISRVMRENITGIRVVKALSKEEYERDRYDKVNTEMTKRERKATETMSLPGPLLSLFLNVGLTLVVYFGAVRVNKGLTDPGVILAFLTYFNMILMGVMGLSRLFLMLSKANASAGRVKMIFDMPLEPVPISEEEAAHTDSKAYIVFDNVSFKYGEDSQSSGNESFAGESRKMSLENIGFEIAKGGSLGIIGPTGCGKTTVINLLMRFYDTTEGHVFVDGKDVRTFDPVQLRQKFGTVFQNDTVFADSIRENISFGRNAGIDSVKAAADDAGASEFIEAYDDGFNHMSDIHGANFSGGQKQRILISRALAANPDILVLDDSSSALDYKTDAMLRKAIRENHAGTTMIVIAQRVSSIMNLDQIMVMDEGRIIGLGTHEELLKSCAAYSDIFNTQMGEVTE